MTTNTDQSNVLTKETILNAVRSYCPGRLRLRMELLRGIDAVTVEAVVGMLTEKPGVLSIQVNPRVGSLLLVWDPCKAEIDLEALAEESVCMFEAARSMGLFVKTNTEEKSKRHPGKEVSAALDKLTETPLEMLSKLIAPDVKKGGRAKRVAQNRLMLILLALSLGSLAYGGARAHTLLGTGFMGLLGVHLWQHRRVL